ncbi:Eco57I restriction-modification methylase domain-containing protein [Actinocrinis puniceicyclus]|uniref:site-specific DNA-methyltransferase (adenine-specific) n=1 Tax=Actinocrinis puniceicyclus TaxID=977794 RepID=A0A8J7WI83_9ACTN|nr:N-6 DNA methylase [Actinocrinis puniceicyclus]MBS2961415.1 Eco57I restriction-modification methylase domain-containing protein [Actinocrinis puniceicyclus]
MHGDALFAIDDLAVPPSMLDAVEHGEVFTRRWVVETILDFVGYTVERDLAAMRIVEPACGGGAFLGPIAERLSASCRKHHRPLLDAQSAVEALELLDHNVTRSRDAVAEVLTRDGWNPDDVSKLVRAWVRQGDYLLQGRDLKPADFIVGNPPYIRLEDVPVARMAAYRRSCVLMEGRADVYVGFYEVGLAALKPNGRLGFICADRWMRNQYGRGLRRLVTRRYSVDLVLSMHSVDAFHEQVSAYPAITIISKSVQGTAVAATASGAFGSDDAKRLVAWTLESAQERIEASAFHAVRLPHWFPGEDSWPAASPARLAMLEDLSDRFRLLEDETTGTQVGIGVATGADGIFITRDGDLVETDRLLPLAMVQDTLSGYLRWQGAYLVNPWDCDGQLVDLRDHPRLAEYFERHRPALSKRYVAGKQPDRWYKTIDKVNHRLTGRAKLLFPDMKLTIHPVLDEGGFYPHHNLYYITSRTWDLRVLGGLLLSGVAEAFIDAYAVKMRGGTLRFQAQYLRRIRVPDPGQLDERDRAALADAFDRRDVKAATEAALRVYGLDELPD